MEDSKNNTSEESKNSEKDTKRYRRTKEQLKKDRQKLLNYLIVNHHNKTISKSDIIENVYDKHTPPLDNRTLQKDFKAVGVGSRQKKYYFLKRIYQMEKCLIELNRILQNITVYHPLIEAQPLPMDTNYSKAPQMHIFSIILISPDVKHLLETQVILTQYIEYLYYQTTDIFFDVNCSNKILKFYFSSQEICESFFNLLCYAKFEPESKLLLNTEIKTLLNKDLISELLGDPSSKKKL